MFNMNKKDDEIIRTIKRFKSGMCPNFYLTGKSSYSMEKLSLRIAKEIDYNKLIAFKGIIKSFSIIMPYFENRQNAEAFIRHLQNSISIARDCYDSYKGIVIIECSEEWSSKGFNTEMNLLLDYIKINTEICFIVLIPDKNEKHTDKLFGEFTRNKLGMKIYCETPSIHNCISLFRHLAIENNLEVSDETKDKLMEFLKNRTEDDLDNEAIVRQMMKQIVFNRYIQKEQDCIIRPRELVCLSGMDTKRKENTIGFKSNNR